MNARKGFTIVEVLMILMILSMILALASPAFRTTLNTASRLGVETDITRMEEAVKLFYLDMHRYPQTVEELWQRPADDRRWRGPYLNPKILVWPPENYVLDNRGKIYFQNTLPGVSATGGKS